MSASTAIASAHHLSKKGKTAAQTMSAPMTDNSACLPEHVTLTDQLLHHVSLISAQRDRSRLELLLVDALRGVLKAESVRLYRLFTPKGDCLAGLAAVADEQRSQILDDGMSWPSGTASIEHFPILHHCLMTGVPQSRLAMNKNLYEHAFPIQRSGQGCFGFLVIDHSSPLEGGERNIVDGLITLFCNCQALLDYSEIDTLTGLLNRKTFDESLIRILTSLNTTTDTQSNVIHLPRRRREAEDLKDHWLGVIDIDHFKHINDTFGHLIGDEVLLMMANLMKLAFRTHDKLFRFGGEEFVVVLKPTEAENAMIAFERFRTQIESYVFPQVGRVTVSIGFARINVDDLPSAVIDNADSALYWAKEHGRNQVFNFEALVEAGDLVAPDRSQNGSIELF